MAQITVRRRGKIKIDTTAAIKAVGDAIVLHILRRTNQRRDVNDAALAPYSELYQKQLAIMNESTAADLRLTGEMMRSVRLLRVTTKDGKTVLTFGPGDKRITPTPRPPPWVFDRKKTPEGRARALDGWLSSRKKRARRLPASLIMSWLAKGVGGRPPRRVLGVSPRGMPEVVRAFEMAGIFTQG